MGYHLKLVISSQVAPDQQRTIMAAAFARWPFCRGPRDPAAYPDRAIFAPPELTSYMLGSREEARQAFVQAADVEEGLLEWSRAFPAVTFAVVEADCFGGDCEYYGFCCRDGQRLVVRDRETGGSLVALVRGVGIEITGPFPPFVRGFFAGPGSGGFE